MIESERIKKAAELLWPFTTHDITDDKKQNAINNAHELLEWGEYITKELNQ